MEPDVWVICGRHSAEPVTPQALWQKTPAKVMHKLGFRESVLQPGFFIHQQKEVHIVTHVDDFLCAGPIEGLKWFKQALSENFDISGQCIGDDDEKNKTRVRTLKFPGPEDLEGGERLRLGRRTRSTSRSSSRSWG